MTDNSNWFQRFARRLFGRLKRSEPKTPENPDALSYAALMQIRFRKNRFAVLGLTIIAGMYLLVLPAEVTAPYSPSDRNLDVVNAPPQHIRFVDSTGAFSLRPFVYGYKTSRDPNTFARVYVVDETRAFPLRLFAMTDTRELLGLPVRLRLLTVEDGYMHLLGTDAQGRDVLSRMIYGGRVSLTVGLLGIAISLSIGTILGIFSGYAGGRTDSFIQRVIEIVLSFPSIPLWMAFSAAIPRWWNPLQVFFAMSLILSFIGWASLARVVRGMTLSLKNEDYVTAARLNGGSSWWIITRHLIPGNFSYIVVSATLAIPYMILGETALSFLGLGIQAPMVSWGVMLQDAKNVGFIANQPWVLIPAVPVIMTVLAFNFVGDGIRDAVDPLSS